MQELIQLFIENAFTLLGILILILTALVGLLRGKLKALGNEFLLGVKILQDAVKKEGPGGKTITDQEQKLLYAQGVRIILEAARHFGGSWMQKILGVKEPTKEEVYYNN